MNRTRMVALLAVACLVLSPLSGASKAGCRSVRVHHGHHVQQSQVFVQPVYQIPHWYQVGQNYQIAAIVQETIKQQMALQAQQLQAQPCPDGSCPTPQSQQLTAPVPQNHSLVRQHCIGCHSTRQEAIDALPADKFLEYLAGEDLESYQARELMQRKILDGEMPPKNPLPAEVLGNVLGQIVRAKTAPQ